MLEGLGCRVNTANNERPVRGSKLQILNLTPEVQTRECQNNGRQAPKTKAQSQLPEAQNSKPLALNPKP